MKTWIAFLFGSSLLIAGTTQAQAAVQFATPEQDRYAKQAVPPAGKALVYVYRLGDGRPQTSPALWLNKRNSGQLEPRTYGMWAAGPGRLEVRAGRVDATPLTITCQAGRIYFVQLAVNADGSASLRQVPYGTGRTEMRAARLVLDPAIAARAAAAPKPVAPIPALAPAKKPVVKEARAASDIPADKGTSGVTLIAKVGSFQLANESQIIVAGLTRNFSAATVAYGLEGEWRLENGFAFGLELFGHTQDYTTTGSAESGDMAVTNVFLNAKKYFRPGALVQPYIGVGIGSATTTFSASPSITINDGASAGGFAMQGMTGIALRWRHVGIYTELKYESAEIEDAAGEKVDASGTGLFAGVSVQF
jgi:opacity protein-like surface antigen